MMSAFLKEATYNAGVTMNSSNACAMKGFDLSVDWPDKIENDKGQVTGYEHGSTQEILMQAVRMTYKEAMAKPNTLALLANLVLGSRTSTQDGALAAYRHRIVPVAHGTALPSMQVEDKFAGIQYAYKGIKGNRLRLTGKTGGYLSLEAELIGSGTREASAASFAASISESWLKMGDCKVFLETGADISIVTSPAWSQGAENISSGTPDALSPRMESFEWTWDNNLKGQAGFGGGLVLQDIDYERRAASLKFSLTFASAAELAYYTAQNPCAMEFNFKGAQIVTASPASTLYYGAILVVPQFRLKAAPLPKAGPNDTITQDFEAEIFEDGTNAASIIEVFNAQAAYLAAA